MTREEILRNAEALAETVPDEKVRGLVRQAYIKGAEDNAVGDSETFAEHYGCVPEPEKEKGFDVVPVRFEEEDGEKYPVVDYYELIDDTIAMGFIDYLDKNRVEGKLCLSNLECHDIMQAFLNKDWAKLDKYQRKYLYGDSYNHGEPKSELDREIDNFTTKLYHETFGNGQNTLDEFDWEDIAEVIDETARYFFNWMKV